MKQLIFSNQTNLLKKPNAAPIDGIYLIDDTSKVADITICVRQGRVLLGYKHGKATKTWLNQWQETIFDVENDYTLERYPWLVTEKLLPGKQLIVLRHTAGIRFYQIIDDKPSLKLLKEDGNFHDVYGYTYLLGNFYPNQAWVGVMTRNKREGIKFYAATKDSFSSDVPDALFTLNRNFNLEPIWRAEDTVFALTKLTAFGPVAIVLRSNNGLAFYQFNADYALQKIATATQLVKPVQDDKLFFANLTRQAYQDILQFNESGLFLFQYNASLRDYVTLQHYAEFALLAAEYAETINMYDINKDGHEDLLYTGAHGLKALSFNNTFNSWQTLLDTTQLTAGQRYAEVVGALPALPPTVSEPTIFLQNVQGQLQSTVVADSETSLLDNIKIDVVANVAVNNTTPTPESTYDDVDIDMPAQLQRTTLLKDKPFESWISKWNSTLFKESVNMANGQVEFSLPLVDTTTTLGLALKLDLFYQSQSQTSALLGLGWSLALAQDYVFVDYKASVFAEDAVYYLMSQGQPQSLTLNSSLSSQDIKHFELTINPELSIEYNVPKQRWLIQNEVEEFVYGKAKNAVTHTLTWPHWRGPGRSAKELQPLVSAWYLSERLSKYQDQALYYDYVQDFATMPTGQKYTSNIRLKSISDKAHMRLELTYAPKLMHEYVQIAPTDEEGNINFPIDYTQQYYLREFAFETATYQQSLKFDYKVENGARLLTAIEAATLLQNKTAALLQFEYRSLLAQQVLSKCFRSSDFAVNYDYEIITPPLMAATALIYPLRERPKIAQGQDYAVVAYRDLNTVHGGIIMRVHNLEMTQTISDCLGVDSLQCPTVQAEIKDFTLQAYGDTFLFLLHTKEKYFFYIYARQAEKWTPKPLIMSFDSKNIIKFNEKLIVATKPTEKALKLLRRIEPKADDKQFTWHETTISLTAPMLQLALHDELVIGYDVDEKLWRFNFVAANKQWQRAVLAKKLGNVEHTLALFDLNAEIRQYYLAQLKQNMLQIQNNFISFGTMQEQKGQLTNKVDLLLLDAGYNVARRQSFELKQENVYDLRYALEADNSTYHLAYVQEDGLYKIRIQALEGEVVKDIEGIKNKNKKADAMNARIKALNELEGFQELFQKSVLFDWQLYLIQISQEGVYSGNNTLLRLEGNDWRHETLPAKQQINLGKYFTLELSNDEEHKVKLYTKHDQQQNVAPLKVFQPAQNQFINRYPTYLAYQTMDNAVEVLTFKDEQTLGQSYKYENENLLLESDWQQLLTVANSTKATITHAEPQQLLRRALSTLVDSKAQLFVNKTKFQAGEMVRSTGYQHTFSSEPNIYIATRKLIPGADKNLSGFYEEKLSYDIFTSNVTQTQNYYDAGGQLVKSINAAAQKQVDKDTSNASNNKETEADTATLLLDVSKRLLISDFSPYNTTDQMTAYYGFEAYENPTNWHWQVKLVL